MKTHQLKCAPDYFAEVWSGDKLHEVRYDDRAYQRGDVVVLHEYDRDALCTDCLDNRHRDRRICRRYSGRWVEARVGFLHATVSGPQGRRPLDPHGHVIFTLLDRVHSDDVEHDPAASTAEAPASPERSVTVALQGSESMAAALAGELESARRDQAGLRDLVTAVDEAVTPRRAGPSPLDLTSRRVPLRERGPRLAYSSETPRDGH